MKKFFWLLLLLPVAIYYFYPEAALPRSSKIDKLVVYKSKRQMQVFGNGKLLKTYRISLGRNPVGHKQFEGDNKTPEGVYTINDRNARSDYHKNLGVSYPNEQDIAFASQKRKSAGGDIKIHGLRNGLGFIGKFQRFSDWTAGCIALTDDEIDELFDAVMPNAMIEIKP